MRILVVGAGAIGGYFGGRLLQAGRDVTFLVRPGRAAALAEHGLQIRSRFGDLHLSPPLVTEQTLSDTFDLVLLSCKAYDLPSAMQSIAKAVGPQTAILPLLNGMAHLDALSERFGADKVLGGLCIISTTLGAQGEILHLNDLHNLTYGERDGSHSARIKAIESVFASADFDAKRSDQILQDMWEKWLFIAAAAGITCLMRATVGDIVAAGGADLALGLVDECAEIAELAGYAPRPDSLARAKAALTAAGSPLTASMLRDVEGGLRVESEQILGDLLRRSKTDNPRSLLRLAYTQLKAYESWRERAQAANPK